MATPGRNKKLSATERAAAIIVALGSSQASEVYKHLTEDEIERLSIGVAKLERLSSEDMQVIVDDFYGLCVTQKVIAEGGAFYAKDVLEKAFGAQLAGSYMERVSQAMQTRAFEFVRKANYKNLMMMLQNEHPQTIAFILSYAKSDQASKIIGELPKDMQMDVIRRIATLNSVSPEIIAVVESVLEKRFSSVVTVDMTEIGGVNYVADIMNHTDRTTEKFIFDELEKSDKALSEDIRKLMFVFEDIVNLSDMDIQRILRDVESQDLAIAVKGSTEEVKQMLLNNVSTRARETILEDIQYLRNVRLKDVEEAQQRIVNIIRKLEETNEITISRGGEEDIVIA
ncbi:flagellar motor switch protein FliG [Scatolibacter rhodanostii]|uniref:flagellar motor switch protein FliG n=1 Tax=Scatolibacter rhodanostii TaxID=2014781 RepID=UPI000C07FCB3|nr:flagellar motor switch protein FliG [Scatolibacter rhodanostii]